MNEPGEPIAWTIRGATEQPGRMPVVFAVALAAAAFGLFVLRQPLLGLVGALMVLGATADYWLGRGFRLDEQGARSRTGPSVTAMEWKDVKRILIRGREIRLSPLEIPSRLDEFRGVGLLTTDENRELVLEFVRSHVPAEAS